MRVSYSLFGEDLVVRTHFRANFDNSSGRFIDVGAFHPFKHSNTMGWLQTLAATALEVLEELCPFTLTAVGSAAYYNERSRARARVTQ